MNFNRSVEAINDGLTGGNEGLFHGMPKMMEYVPNIQRGNIYLLGGISGSGKSALATDMFICSPYEDYYNNKKDKVKLKIFVWSIEISPEILMTKIICRKIYKDTGKLVDLNYVLSRGKLKIAPEITDLIRSYAPYFEEFEDRVIINGQDNPTGIYKTIMKYLHANGKVLKKKIKIKTPNLDTQGNHIFEEIEVFDRYVPYDPNLHIILVIDHLGIMRLERSMAIKANIDKMMEYSLDLARDYKITVVPLQQLNRNLETANKLKISNIDPQRNDYKDSSVSTEAAHYIFGLCYPQAWEILDYRGYNLGLLKNRFRGIKLIKNRDGNADVVFGAKFIGEVGVFEELPKPKDMTTEHYTAIANITKYYKQT